MIRLSVSDEDAKLRVETRDGRITIALSELDYGTKLKVLDGKAQVERVPIAVLLTDGSYEDDYPTLAYGPDGSLWVAWIAYGDHSDHVYVRTFKGGDWKEPIGVTEQRGDRFRVRVVADAQGRTWVVWSEFVNGNWDLYGRSFINGSLSETVRLTEGPGPDIFHELVADRTGKVWLVWQSFRPEGDADICLRYLEKDQWSNVIVVSSSTVNDWEPSVAVSASGDVWVVWDSYDNGNYDVFARSYSKGELGRLIQVTKSPRFQAHAHAAFDRDDRLWIAWDEAETNWGKNWGFYFEGPGNPLYRSRKLKVACILTDGSIKEPAMDIMEAIPKHLRRYSQLPRIQADSEGRIWVFFRCRTGARLGFTTMAAGAKWEILATYYYGGKWYGPISLPNSVGRNDQGISTVLDGAGYVWSAWSTNNILFGGVTNPLGELPRNHDVYAAVLNLKGMHPERLVLKAFEEHTETVSPVHPEERANIAAIRNYQVEIAGKKYRIYRGDLHRHTDISQDGGGDGSLLDFYRYCMDAAALDFGAVTDHSNALQDYSWWRTMKSADLFLVPGFTPLFAYERSLVYPNGHRNVVFAQRVGVLSVGRSEQSAQRNTRPILYPYLKRNNGIAMPHSSATRMGTDWRDNDPEVEPLVEIFQGQCEIPMSTKAMKKRHTYAATDNIILDFRMNDAETGTLMRVLPRFHGRFRKECFLLI